MCPKELFAQFEIYKKINGIEEEKKSDNGIPQGYIDEFL